MEPGCSLMNLLRSMVRGDMASFQDLKLQTSSSSKTGRHLDKGLIAWNAYCQGFEMKIFKTRVATWSSLWSVWTQGAQRINKAPSIPHPRIMTVFNPHSQGSLHLLHGTSVPGNKSNPHLGTCPWLAEYKGNWGGCLLCFPCRHGWVSERFSNIIISYKQVEWLEPGIHSHVSLCYNDTFLASQSVLPGCMITVILPMKHIQVNILEYLCSSLVVS